jgi:hypothetical protein
VSENRPTDKSDREADQGTVPLNDVESSSAPAEVPGGEKPADELAPATSSEGRSEQAGKPDDSAAATDEVPEHTTPTSNLEEKAKAQDEEIQLLKQRIQEQDERWQQLNKLLSNVKQPDSPGPTSSTVRAFQPPWTILALAAGLAVLVVAGVLYLRSGNQRNAELQNNVASAKPQQPSGSSAQSLPDQGAPPAAKPAPTSESQTSVPIAVQAAQPAATPAQVAAHVQAAAVPPDEEEPPSGAEESKPSPPRKRSSAPVLSRTLSDDLNDYLHHNHLPHVAALVFTNSAGEPSLVKLSGRVKTDFGKKDAAVKSKDFLGARVQVKNSIEVAVIIDPHPPVTTLGAETPIPTAAPNACAELCRKDALHCNNQCQNQAVPSSLSEIFGAGQRLIACKETCQQTLDHCEYDCNQTGSPEPPSGGSGEPPEGPDQPPG